MYLIEDINARAMQKLAALDERTMALLADSTVDLYRANNLIGGTNIDHNVPLDPAVLQILSNIKRQRRTL